MIKKNWRLLVLPVWMPLFVTVHKRILDTYGFGIEYFIHAVIGAIIYCMLIKPHVKEGDK